MRPHLRDPAHVSGEWLRAEWEGPRDGAAPGWTGEVVAALYHGENRSRLLSEATSEGVLVHEAGLVLDANQTLAKMLGYARGAVSG